MEAARWRRMFEIFDLALQVPPAQRDDLVSAKCGDDVELRSAVSELLDSHERTGGVLEHSQTVPLDIGALAEGEGEAEGTDFVLPAEEFGPYRVVDRLGEGGFGTVYLAERLDGDFEQRVAIKVLRAGHDSREVLRRFQQERRILARLEHPNIARLIDGGTASDGRPYVVLERVEGVPIDRFCSVHDLGIDARLDLFLQVCAAVHSAHQNLVVHRDLKPGNVLVTADGTPKLLDFGIAKLLADDEAQRTVTELRALTPRYASPEQVRGEAITTSSDVYSLGVLLYELLTGCSPYHVDSTHPFELARAVIEQDPLPPSLVAGRRVREGETVPMPPSPSMSRRLRGDLDTIVLKALEKEPGRRYGSVQELAEDLERHRDGLPVRARPATLIYRARKFARRHTVAVAAAALVVVLLGGWIVTMSVESARTERALERAERITQLLVEVFSGADPETSPEELTARQILADGEHRVREELQDDPEVRASLLNVIGSIDANLGLREQAEELLREALALRLELHGEVDADVADTRLRLGATLFHLGQYDESEKQLRAALDVRRRLFGTDDPEQAEILRTLGWIAHDRGDLDRAEELYRESLALRRRALGSEHPKTARSEYDVASLLLDRGDLDAAEPLLRHAATVLVADDKDHGAWAGVRGQLGWLLLRKGQLVDAEGVLREVYESERRRLGSDHTRVAVAATRLASTLRRLGRLDEAEDLFREAVDIYRTKLGPRHSYTATAMTNLGGLLHVKGDLAGAEREIRGALEILEEQFGPDHPLVADALHSLGGVLLDAGKPQQAEALLRRAHELDRKTLGDDAAKTMSSLSQLGLAVLRTGRREEGRALLEEALELRRRHLPPDHPDLADSLTIVGEIQMEDGNLDLAESYLRKALEIRAATLPPGHPSWAVTAASLGATLTRLGRWDEAAGLLEESRRILAAASGEESREVEKVDRFRDALRRAKSAAGGESLP